MIAPLPEAQLAETFALNQVHIQTLIATKAARVRLAARDRPVVDFGTRRAHGFDAALKAARAAYLAGLAGTSNILAARRYGVPCVGTMAHSYVQAHDSELEAFEKFSRLHPGTTLLVDTYDTLEGVRKVIEMANRDMARFDVDSIRMDSGDIAALAARSRSMLDDAGLDKVKILASGGLDEYEIRSLVTQNAPVDGFGIGTELVVSGDAPHVDLSYKLVEYAGTPRMKLSPGKTSLPGRKQVFRRSSAGRFTGDTLAASHERHAGEPMLVQVMRQGSRTEAGKLTLDEARERCARELDSLPEALRELEPHAAEARYPVVFSEHLARSKRRIEAGLKDSLQGTTVNL